MKQKINPKCPVCGKKLFYNIDKKRFECPVFRPGMHNKEKKGCGYILDQKVLTGW